MGKKFDKYTVGTCYYPEHWDQTLWADDLDRMLKAGITVIRIAEFAWSKVEETEGSFSYAFFDEFLDLCRDKGMQVIMGTPTATPPAWLTRRYPEVLNADINGIPYRHGGRRHYNYNSPVYRRLSARIVEKMAEHYGPHPAVIGWQLDNELNCETSDFYSEADQTAFRAFLRRKYGSLEALNQAWGSVFWNQTYTDWDEVLLPGKILAGHNPQQRLDYIRFISDSVLGYARMQSDIIRKYAKPGDFITTNGMFDHMDNHKLTDESLDIYMYDSYPNFAFGLQREAWVPTNLRDRHWSRNLTDVRGICPHFGIMEQQAGAGGAAEAGPAPAPRPGQLTLWAMQSLAHGADYISFFRWRTACIGSEIYWHGILDYDNRDNRKLAEVTAFAESLKKIGEIVGADYKASFALLSDYDNDWDACADRWHGQIEGLSRENIFLFSQRKHIPYNSVYFKDGLTAEDLAAYPLVIYPHPAIMTEERMQVLRKYAAQGGTLLIGCRSGYKDINGRCIMQPQPGLLAELTGTDVRDFTFVHECDQGMKAVFTAWSGMEGRSVETPLFNDILSVRSEAEEANAGMADAAAADADDTDRINADRNAKGRAAVYGAGTVRMNADSTDAAGTAAAEADTNGYDAGRAEVLASYAGGYYKGEPALTMNRYGRGRVLHLGSCFSEDSLAEIFAYLGIACPVDSISVPENVELAVRTKGNAKYFFLLNYMFSEETVELHKPYRDLLTGQIREGRVTMPPFGVMVLQ